VSSFGRQSLRTPSERLTAADASMSLVSAGSNVVGDERMGASVLFRVLASLLATTSVAVAQTSPPCDLANGTSVVGNHVTLLEDLDCTGYDYPSVVLVNGGVLDLNGFTLKANHAVRCDHESKPCVVMSSQPGGTLQGTLPDVLPGLDSGIIGDAGVRVIGVTITAFRGYGIDAAHHPGEKITVVDSTVTANGETGVIGAAVQLFGSIVSSNGFGGVTSATIIEDSEVTGNAGFGVAAARKLRMTGSTVSGNGGDGVRLNAASYERNAPRAVLTDSTVSNNAGDGLRATDRGDGRVTVRTSIVSGNTGNGIGNIRIVKAQDSMFDGNGASGIETSSAEGCRVSLTGSGVGANAVFGVTLGFADQPCSKGRFRASASTLTGSGVDADCFVTRACGDVASSTLPVLDTASACQRSYVLGTGFPGNDWDVCTLD
jgi:hypothetical protein